LGVESGDSDAEEFSSTGSVWDGDRVVVGTFDIRSTNEADSDNARRHINNSIANSYRYS